MGCGSLEHLRNATVTDLDASFYDTIEIIPDAPLAFGVLCVPYQLNRTLKFGTFQLGLFPCPYFVKYQVNIVCLWLL